MFLQAGFNPRTLQGLGLTYTLYPALRALYPEALAQKAAMQRHLRPFNTHPYAAAAIVGGIIFHEERVARGEYAPERVDRFKDSLMGPLAALGDGFFWLSLRPAVGALSVALVPFIGGWAAVVFAVLYNVVHLSTRAHLFSLGLREGDALVDHLQRLHAPLWSKRLRNAAAFFTGATAAWLCLDFGRGYGGDQWAGLTFASLSLGALAWFLKGKSSSPAVLLYTSALLAGLLGFFF